MQGKNEDKKMRRRPKGSGTEWKDAKGNWHLRKETGPNPRTGKRRFVTVTAPTKSEARAKLEARLELLRGEGSLPLTETPTLDVWARRWLRQTRERVKPRTYDTYLGDVNAITGQIGGLRIDRITPDDIERMCTQLAKTRSAKTVRNKYTRLQQILGAAVRERLIPSNPALAAIPPRVEPAHTRILDAGQPAAAIQAALHPAERKWDMLKDTDADHDMWRIMFSLAFSTGMRQAERFAITPSELVTRNGIHGIQIAWELQKLAPDAHIPNWLRARHLTGRFWLVQPKSRHGERFVPVDNATWMDLLGLAAGRKADDLIFTHRGQPLTSPIERRRWKRALQDAGLPDDITMRSARHFFSTHLAETGASEDARMAIMGHAKITTTAGYTHWAPETLQALADEAREAIGEPASV